MVEGVSMTAEYSRGSDTIKLVAGSSHSVPLLDARWQVSIKIDFFRGRLAMVIAI